MNLYGYEFQRESDLMHYGVMGMKWGIRRYQNSDGTLTAEGRTHYGSGGENGVLTSKSLRQLKKDVRREIRTENRKAEEIGRNATISSEALKIARKKADKADQKYEKNPSEKNYRKKELFSELKTQWEERYSISEKEAKNHFDELVSKYGKNAIAEINRDKNGNISESVASTNQLAADMVISVASMASFMAGLSPVAIMMVPKGKRELGWEAFQESKRLLKSQKRTFEKKNPAQLYTKDEYKSYLRDNKESLLNNAKKNDQYDMEFLERVSDEVLHTGGSELISEYSRYIDDPDNYHSK